MTSILRGFLLSFAIELLVLAVIHATLNPSRGSLFILWVAVGCALAALAYTQIDTYARIGHWNALALIVSPVLVFGATWLLFGFSYALECGGAGSPLLDVECS